jgi:hypothetical protein
MRTAALIALLMLGITELTGGTAPQLGSARVMVPALVVLDVPDVSSESIAGSPITVTFDSAILLVGQALRISVRADGDLTIPGGTPISASNLSWTTANVTNGVGLNGALSKTVYTTVYQGNAGATSGRLDVTWRLSPPGGGIRAGTRQAALRWRFEAITP